MRSVPETLDVSLRWLRCTGADQRQVQCFPPADSASVSHAKRSQILKLVGARCPSYTGQVGSQCWGVLQGKWSLSRSTGAKTGQIGANFIFFSDEMHRTQSCSAYPSFPFRSRFCLVANNLRRFASGSSGALGRLSPSAVAELLLWWYKVHAV